MSNFFTKLYKLCGTKIKLSIAYHIETDGQTERTNNFFEDMLKIYVSKKQSLWDKWLYIYD